MTRRGWVLFILLSVVWGLPYLLIKVAVAEVGVPAVVFARVFLGAAILLPFAVRGGQLAGVFRHWRALTAFSLFEFMIPWGLLSHAEVRLTSAMAGLLMATIPIFALSIEKLMGSAEHLGARRVGGLLLGFGGVFILARPSFSGDSWAILEVLLAALSYAAAAIVAARALKSVPALPMITWCLALAALVYLPAVVVSWRPAMPSLQAIGALAALAVVCTALAFVWYVELIREAGVGRAVVITYTNPAVAVTAGMLFLNEPLTPAMVSALVVILSGSALATARAQSEGGVRMSSNGERIVQTNGVELCVETFGDVSDPAMLLIHGACASMLWWEEELCERIARQHRFVIRFDNRDTGRSTTFPVGHPGYSLRDMATDAVGILDALGIGKAHIVGRSMAGGTTLILGVDHPDRVLSLTFVSTTPGDSDLPPMSDAFLDAVSEGPDLSSADATVESIVKVIRAYHGQSGFFDEHATRALARRDVARSRNIEAAMTNHFVIDVNGPAAGGFGDIKAPTLVIHGELDPVYPLAHGQALQRSVPGAELLVLQGAGHALPRERWDVFVSAIAG